MSRPAGVLSPADGVGPAEQARRRAVTRYGVLGTGAERQFDEIAELAAQVTGCTRAAITFAGADELWVKAAHGLPVDAVAGHLSSAGVCAAEPLTTADGFTIGHLVVMDRTARPLRDAEQRGLAALARQVLVLLELRRTALYAHTVIDAAGLVVFHLDADLRMVTVTPTWAGLTGYGVVRSLGGPLTAVLRPDDRRVADAHLQRVLHDGVSARWDCALRTLPGTDIPVEVFATPLPPGHGPRPGVVGVLTDISERRARELELEHTRRLESLGRLAAGVAHEINTPIQFVGDNTRFLADACTQLLAGATGYRDLLADASLSDAARHQAAEAIAGTLDLDDLAAEVPSAVTQTLDGVDRVATIVRAMKSLSHPGHQEAVAADINEALRSTVTVARNETKYDAHVTVELGVLPRVPCFIADLGQVFLNLLVNAADAVRDSGRHGRISVRSHADAEHIVVTISDTGVGIPAAVQQRMFEPFFTTKPVGRGTGQGLAFARAVVDKHGGSLNVRSTVGEGSTFTVRIPLRGPVREGRS